MRRRHLARAWEYNRFWQKEQERQFGSRLAFNPVIDDDLPEHLRMPRTRGEMNRFRLTLKKSKVEAQRGQTVSVERVLAEVRRKLREYDAKKEKERV